MGASLGRETALAQPGALAIVAVWGLGGAILGGDAVRMGAARALVRSSTANTTASSRVIAVSAAKAASKTWIPRLDRSSPSVSS